MQLDRKDDVLPGGTQGLQALDHRAVGTADTWFADRAPAVAVVVKRRRLAGPARQDRAAAGTVAAEWADEVRTAAASDSSTDASHGLAARSTRDASHAATDSRPPRVFVLPREPGALAHGAPGAPEGPASTVATDGPAATPSAPGTPRRRRRRQPDHRPSAVVHIVPPPREAEPAVDDGFVLDLPGVDEWQQLQAALAGVRRLVHDAGAASQWGLAPAPGPRRRRAG